MPYISNPFKLNCCDMISSVVESLVVGRGLVDAGLPHESVEARQTPNPGCRGFRGFVTSGRKPAAVSSSVQIRISIIDLFPYIILPLNLRRQSRPQHSISSTDNLD